MNQHQCHRRKRSANGRTRLCEEAIWIFCSDHVKTGT